LINQLTAALEQVWPGYLKIFSNVASLTSMAILERFSNPKDAIKANETEILTLIASHSRRGHTYAEKKYIQLIDSANEALSIGINRSGSIKVVEVYANCLRLMLAEIDKLQAEIDSLSATIPEVKLLMTIPGIGAKIAAVLAAEIGDINRFKNYKQLVAYCGIDPRVFQSGNFTATNNKFTKRGSPFLRRGLYLAATVAIRKDSKGNMVNPMIYEYYQNKIQSKARKKALGAIMNKLTRIIFSVLKHQKQFEFPVAEQTTIVSNIVEMKTA
jgi:transposase